MYASFNQISNLFDLSFLTNLNILDLEGNAIEEIDNIKHLANNSNLLNLTLYENPISNDKSYLSYLKQVLPNLLVLDEQEINNWESKNIADKSSAQNIEFSEISYENQLIEKLRKIGISEEELQIESKEALKYINLEEISYVEINSLNQEEQVNENLKIL